MATPGHPFYVPGLLIPRFLFRGFNRYSGGGFPGQNTTEGILPLGFIQGYDQKMEVSMRMDPSDVKARARMHCVQRTSHPTPFSSWSHDLRTALGFSYTRQSYGNSRDYQPLEEDEDCYIAVLDTWALGDEKRVRNRIFHLSQFDIPGLHIPCEWLIWGPVSGPAYRCVSLSTIREAVNCQKWPGHVPSKDPRRYLLDKEIWDSMLVAGCFQRKDDASADVMLAVAAAEMSRRFWGQLGYISPDGDLESSLDREPRWPQGKLGKLLAVFALCEPILSGRPLVNGNTALEGFPRVKLMYDLLSDAEARWRHNNIGTIWSPVDWKHILGENLKWQESPCQLCVEKETLEVSQPTKMSQPPSYPISTPDRRGRGVGKGN